MMADTVWILDGNNFVLSDGSGDILTDRVGGFFQFDTRCLSHWQLTLNGEQLHALAVTEPNYFRLRFFLVPGSPTHYVDAKVSVIRERCIAGSGFEERVTVLNHDRKAVDFRVRLAVDSDFAPVYAIIAQPMERSGRVYRHVEEGRLRLGYEREKFRRETTITSSEPVRFDEYGLTYDVRVGPHGRWSTLLRVDGLVLRPDGEDTRAHTVPHRVRSAEQLQSDLDRWVARAPRLSCDWEALNRTYRRSLLNLAGLRFTPLGLPDVAMPAAGLPWAATISGRDSILCSLQSLSVAPELAVATLRMLALNQGSVLDDFRDEEPGKIVRQFRYGELSAFEERPESPYYGSADATPLYVILLDEYERWSGDAGLVMQLEDTARAALAWIDEYGDIMGDGYVWYQSRNERTGLVNQGWKESPDAISYRDGTLPGLPRATCELQGYAYDAKMRGARLARVFWNDPAYADRLEREAAALKERFNRDFWVTDGEYFALALEPDGRQVDALSSNMGHLLWSGIVDESRAERVAGHLLSPRLFSGWGVRTLAKGEGRYNPLGYHVGAVWPFDNSLIAWGLRRYGFLAEAGMIAEGIIDAANYFGGGLPESIAGYDRDRTGYPVSYPTANSPQAVATGAPFLLLRVLMGLEPIGDELVVSPALPSRFGRIELLDIPGRWGRRDAIGNARQPLRG
ncbi:glycogen debranching N-terminal domain-containing protein [Micromonospora krabiensis]|uniref:Glycogen debranching enzyme (Alpha-1,6-glucosidase) n=1 Tax=Micromonospora krabiensis TaxID=307121 RepID=A0A1C3MZZ8_9ACTN|nr:glycogen debranching N-terminal domain-containing protein [Micromonospora krabiensis]SBV25899.1 Glycogen debranching enzyme (alpha-1,6-glucosidase) [Micromonospora krabiensis]